MICKSCGEEYKAAYYDNCPICGTSAAESAKEFRPESRDLPEVLPELSTLRQQVERLERADARQREELVRLRLEHKDALECAANDDPNATDGMNGWAKRITAERNALQQEVERLRTALEESGYWVDMLQSRFGEEFGTDHYQALLKAIENRTKALARAEKGAE